MDAEVTKILNLKMTSANAFSLKSRKPTAAIGAQIFLASSRQRLCGWMGS